MELDSWLRDQVRQGLAASQRAGYLHWDDIAARMVDAQAPGLAERLRALAAVPHSGPGWDGRLLEEYALLRLLAVACRDQGRLPQPLRDTVRSRVGFTVRQAEVLASAAPVRDRWQVLARRDLESDRIRTRRAWLRGRRTGRAALVLSFAAAGQPLDDSLAVGTEIDADLAFYPGAVALRALVAVRRDADPGDTEPGDTGALRARAAGDTARRGRDHRRRVAGRICRGARRGPLAGHLARRAGRDPGPGSAARPARRGRGRPAAAPRRGRLLAAVRAVRRTPADRGRRVDAARPVAADRVGREREAGTAMTAWHDLVTASLIGTERTVVPAVRIPGLPRGEDDAGDPAAVLLDRAALVTAARRAGRRPDQAQPLPECENDPRPAVSPAAADRLARMLTGEYSGLLAEWLTVAVARGLRPPPQFLPALLDRARRDGPAAPG